MDKIIPIFDENEQFKTIKVSIRDLIILTTLSVINIMLFIFNILVLTANEQSIFTWNMISHLFLIMLIVVTCIFQYKSLVLSIDSFAVNKTLSELKKALHTEE